jgi:hypothetical protein
MSHYSLSRTFRLQRVLQEGGYLSTKDRRVRYCAMRLLNIVDEDEGYERELKAEKEPSGKGYIYDAIDFTGIYRGPTTHGQCIGEGCYWTPKHRS